MRTIITTIIILVLSATAIAQNTGKSTNLHKGMGDKYVPGYSKYSCTCEVNEKDGKLSILQNGMPVRGEIEVAPSVKITADGKLKKQNGAERILKDGNCVSEKGTITMLVK